VSTLQLFFIFLKINCSAGGQNLGGRIGWMIELKCSLIDVGTLDMEALVGWVN
jgi:hypothetical protein